MKRFILMLILLLVACPHPTPPSQAAPVVEAGPSDCNLDSSVPVCPAWEVHFSPNGGCQKSVIDHIKASKKTIRVQAYTLTAPPITEALIAAKNSGVDVQVILDSTESKMKYSALSALRTAGVPVYIDAKHAIAHNKVMIFDSSSVETGSYNYTNAAEHDNAENCLFLEAATFASPYAENWNVHKDHSSATP